MSLLTYIRVENFRSVRLLEVDGLSDYVPIIGLNSSGKSNMMRALNLFFNSVVDEGNERVSLVQDYSDYAPKGKKKSISVTIGLNLRSITVRGQEDFQSQHGITSEIFIKRSWSLANDNKSLVMTTDFGSTRQTLRTATPDEQAALDTYVRSIRFIYIPNHTRPSDLIRSELEPLSPRLVSRLRRSKAYKDASMKALFGEFGKMGDRLFGDVSTALARGLPNTEIAADLPTDFAELAFTVGVQAISDGNVARSPEFEGSGSQSFLLLHILNLADRTSRAGGFGWVQASIWAMEEPESFLHAGLRAQFSSDLREYANDERRQVLVTTHQDEFVRVADEALLASKDADGTSVVRLGAREALIETTRRAITTFRHPLFVFPDFPIVIIEGKFDALYLRAAIKEANIRPRWRLISPDEAFGEGTGGDTLLQYLKYNKQVIASRPTTAPIVVVRDWETTDTQKYANALNVHPQSRALKAPEDMCNPSLDESWAGVERHLSTPYIESVVPRKDLLVEQGDVERYSIKKSKLNGFKQKLADAVDGPVPVGPYMHALVRWIDEEVAAILDEVPTADFL